MALQTVHSEQKFGVGDTIKVHQRIQEDQKTRTQVFEGTVIAIKGEGQNMMFTVRRLGSGGIGIERIFPLYSPLIEKVAVVAEGAVRRAKLYYLREKPAREVAEITKRVARKRQAAKPAKPAKTRKRRSPT